MNPNIMRVMLCLGVVIWAFQAFFNTRKQRKAYRPFRDMNQAAARFATEAMCRAAGMFGGRGFRYGYSLIGKLLRAGHDMFHQVILGGTGSGKTSGFMATNALDADDKKLFAIDMKGQLLSIIERHRLKLGPVYPIDPYGLNPDFIKSPPARINLVRPLCDGTIAPQYIHAEALKLAFGCVLLEGEKAEQFWANGGRRLCADCILGLVDCGRPEEQNLSAMARYVRGDAGAYFTRMANQCKDPALASRFRNYARKFYEGEKTFSGLLETFAGGVDFLDDPAIAAVVEESDFSFYDRETIDTVCVVVPLQYSEVTAKFLRLMTAAALSAYLYTGTSKTEVSMLIDEAGNIGNLPAIPQAYGMARDFGVSMTTVFTDLHKMSLVYPDYQSILGNSSVIVLPSNDPMTIDYVAKRCGTTEVVQRAKSVHTDKDGEPQVTVNLSTVVRPLLHGYEFAQLSRYWAVMITANMPPVLLKIKRYFEDSTLSGRYGVNPYFRKKR